MPSTETHNQGAVFNLGTQQLDVSALAECSDDFALVKHTRFGEKTDVELRAEVFNITNTPAFSQPNGSFGAAAFGAAAFGTITSTTTDPRVAQLAIHLSR